MPATALYDAQSRKRLSEGETELHEDPEANIGREVSYRSDSSCSKVPPHISPPLTTVPLSLDATSVSKETYYVSKETYFAHALCRELHMHTLKFGSLAIAHRRNLCVTSKGKDAIELNPKP